MKRTIFSLICTGIIAVVLFASCSKNGSQPLTDIEPAGLDEVFSSLCTAPQVFNFHAGTEIVIYANEGTKLHFYPNSFKDAGGSVITSGIVCVRLTEMYKAGAMIANRATTMAGGRLLQSGGEVYLTATQNGKPVYANSYRLGFSHKCSSNVPMALFYGSTNNPASIAVWSQSAVALQGSVVDGTIADSYPHTAPLFIFDSVTNFTWTNCGSFYPFDSAKTSVSVVLPDGSFNESNTQMYLVLPDIKQKENATGKFISVMSNLEQGPDAGTYDQATNTMNLVSHHQVNTVPRGAAYQLVVIANKNGTWYYFQQDGTIPHDGLVATASMQQLSVREIKNKLAGL